MKSKTFFQIGRLAIVVITIFSILFPLNIAPTAAQGTPRLVTIFGPVTIERGTGKPITADYRIVLPSSIIGPYSISIINGAGDSSKITSGKLILNGQTIFFQKDFKQKSTILTKQISLEPVNELSVAVDIASKPGSRLEISITGYDTTPEEIVVSEERSTLGPGGGIVSLPDVGEVELEEEIDRPNSDVVIREMLIPALQNKLAHALPDISTLVYEKILELESSTPLATSVAIRLFVPTKFSSNVPPGQIMDLFVETGGEEKSFETLDALFDPATGEISGSIPPFYWQDRENPSVAQSPVFVTANAATTVKYLRIILGTKAAVADSLATGKFTSISGQGTVVPVQGNEKITIGVQVYLNSLPSIGTPLGSINVKSGYGDLRESGWRHDGVDFGTGGITGLDMLAVRGGVVNYNNDGGTNCNTAGGTSHDNLYGYGHYAIVEHYSSGLFPHPISTLYGHLTPGSDTYPDANGHYETNSGDRIAKSGNSGCSTGPHTHFELWTSSWKKANPCPYFNVGLAGCESSLLPRYLRLTFNGIVVAGSQVNFQPNQFNYQLPLDLTKYPVPSGSRKELALQLIDERGAIRTLDYATLQISQMAMKVTLTWDKYDTDVDTHVYDTLGNHSAYWNLCGIPNGCLDRDDVDGFGPEVFTLTQAAKGMVYTVRIHYYSDHGNGPTTAKVVVEVNGQVVTTKTVTLVSYQWADIGLYTPNP